MLVSICIPTFNGEKFLQEALNSIKLQTYKNIEVIISDDESKDKTLEICLKFKSEVNFPVFIYSHKPAGIGSNWNHTIKKSNGEYIKLLFQDDVLESDCVEVMMNYLLKSNLEFVVSKREIINADSKKVSKGIWYKNFNDLQQSAGIPVNQFFILSKKNLKELNFNRYSVDNIVGEPCASLFAKKAFLKVGHFDLNLKQALDYVYWLKVLVHYDIGIINQKLVKFRYHSEQTSNQNNLSNLDESDAIKNILYQKLLFYIDRKSAFNYLKRKYPLLQKLNNLRYKILS